MQDYPTSIQRMFQQLCPPEGADGSPQRDFLWWLLNRHADLGGLTEIRIISPNKPIWAGLFTPDNFDQVVSLLQPRPVSERHDAHPRSGDAHIYFGTNPVRRDRSRGTIGRLAPTKTAVRDEDVLAYSLTVVDIDPVRAVSGTSATDLEKARARDVAMAIAERCVASGIPFWPADSGNGYHLLFPLKPVTGEGISHEARLIQALLRALSTKFSTPGAEVDLSTFNPSRVLKLYGTRAVKGSPTADRPHRLSVIAMGEMPNEFPGSAILDAFTDVVVGNPRRDQSPTATSAPNAWGAWRKTALMKLDPGSVYGEWLTGREGVEWIECRDPWSPSGDQKPSAGVANGSGNAERGAFHTFRTSATISVFDFVIARGRALDFRGALQLVADLSGVPLPDSRSSTTPKRERPPASTERPATDGEQSHVGSRPVVKHNNVTDQLEDVHRSISLMLQNAGRFYSQRGRVIEIDGDRPPLVVTRDNLPGKFSAFAEFARIEPSKEGDILHHIPMPQNIAGSWVENSEQRKGFPELRSYLWLPVFTKEWRWLGAAGYDSASRCYYGGQAVVPDGGQTDLLNRLLCEFPWRSGADRANYLGAMLTLVTLPHWFAGHALVFIVGNKPRLGKSKLARMLGHLADGCEPLAITYNARDEEFEKKLATGLAIGRHVMFIDNVRGQGALGSQSLEAATLSPRPSFRRLGVNDVICREANDALFCMTVNHGHLDADLAQRMLPIRLEFDGDPGRREFVHDDPVAVIERERLQVLAALAGMVQNWLDAGQPMLDNPARHSTGGAWAPTIDAILRNSGYDGFLSNFEESAEEVDPFFSTLQAVAEALWITGPGYAAEWAERVEQIGIVALWKPEATQRGRETSLANYFRAYLHRIFHVAGGLDVELVAVPGEKTRYHFRVVNGQTSQTSNT